MTEEVGGITLEEAKDEAMDALDTTVVANQLRDRLVGQYYRVEGREFGQNLLANDVVETERASVDDLLVQARTLQAERAGGAAPASAD
jgi:ssDNA-binding replication factor A large subunit